MNREDEAIKLFKEKYGKTPKELGFPVIDIYEKQNAFLYAVSEEVIAAYKLQQNITRGMWLWGIWPLLVVLFVEFIAIGKYQDLWHPLSIAGHVIFGITAVLYTVLYVKARNAEKLFHLGDDITFLNY